MGQKVNPNGFRVGKYKNWQSEWFASGDSFKDFLLKDIKIREFLEKELKDAAVASIQIKRNSKKTEVIINTAKPGNVIGHKGEAIEKLRSKLAKVAEENVQISIAEIKQPDLSAKLVADNIARQIENRVSFRMAQKRAIRNAMKAGAKGIKTMISGRLGGADMARSERYSEGTTPLHTLRADIDYATSEADTTFGKIGVKVWIYKGEILPTKKSKGGNDNAANTKKN